MTDFGLDASHYQGALDVDRLNLRTRQGYTFFLAKATEGTGYRDPSYHGFRAQAQAEGLYFGAYHFLHHGDAAAQADYFCEFVTDPTIPITLDVEAGGATVADAVAFEAQAAKRGRRVSLLYLPHWYWQQIGSPVLTHWKGRLFSSAYPSGAHETAAALYPGRGGGGWSPYGGVAPVIWQYASSGKVDGYSGNVDLDAFEGGRALLSTLFKDYAPHTTAAPPRPVQHHHPNIDSAEASIHAAIAANHGHTSVLAHLEHALADLRHI